jgi:hypothetical protein
LRPCPCEILLDASFDDRCSALDISRDGAERRLHHDRNDEKIPSVWQNSDYHVLVKALPAITMAQVLLTCTLLTILPSKKVACAHDERYRPASVQKTFSCNERTDFAAKERQIVQSLHAKDAAWSLAGFFEQDPESSALQYRIIGGKTCIELSLDDILRYVKDYIVNGVCIAS